VQATTVAPHANSCGLLSIRDIEEASPEFGLITLAGFPMVMPHLRKLAISHIEL